jgi:diaminopimelate decarboxylase
MAVKNNVGRIVLDNFCELKMLEKICSEYGKKIDIAMRIKPGVSAHTHEFIRTGQIDSKFGFAIETGEAMRAIKYIGQIDQINLKELHCHIGSQIFDVEPFVLAAQVMMDFISSIRSEIGITIKELNLGGGFGIAYTKNDNPPSCEDYMKFISKAIREKARDFNLPMPYLYLEPGRSIVGEAGVTLYTVGAIKEIPNIRTWVSIDGGMCDNPRYALYRSDYTALIANKVEKDNDFKVTIAGKCCESGDLIQENAWIPKPKPGDIMAIISTGAYNYSMASNYNRIPKPAVVMLKDGKARLIVKRQTLDDLLKNDL